LEYFKRAPVIVLPGLYLTIGKKPPIREAPANGCWTFYFSHVPINGAAEFTFIRLKMF
jgi:hypothetical protein